MMDITIADVDVLVPWGPGGPPPPGQWSPDVLGPGFSAQTLPLLDDEEGAAVATLVRYEPDADPLFTATATAPTRALLYLHGRNDYFFHAEFARFCAASGIRLYALDLRKYGRSLRPGQTFGFVTDLAHYDEEIGLALDLIGTDLPLILMGHSTGGLVATLWAYRHPGVLSGLILNSAWLELQSLAAMRPAMQQVISRVAARHPHTVVLPKRGDLYGPSLSDGWAGSGLDIPENLEADDPSVAGWDYAIEWKRPDSYPALAGWLQTILEAQQLVNKEVDVDCPVLSFASTSSGNAEEWSTDLFQTDVVLDSDVIVDRSARLGHCVTIVRLPGKHDLLLSDRPVRQELYLRLGQWLQAFVTDRPLTAP